jgi:predicted ATPase/class 3 adenylate cyclase
MSTPPSGTVTFLFTDIEGSARLWEDHPESMRAALARHDQILNDAIACNGGFVVKTTGDGLFAAFGRAEAALTAVLAAQVALVAVDWGATGALRVRMGLHTGDAEFRDGDYHGPAVNRAARLTTASHGGQVLMSGATAGLVGEGLPEGAELVALGEHRLRDLGRPEVLFQLAHPDLPGRFAPLRTLDAFPGNLPLQMSSFIGREKEIAKILSALDEARAVTLTGVGGVGKTRLALQVSARLLPRFRDGAWLVELAPIRDPGGVPGAFATVLGISSRSGLTLEESLVDLLRTKQLLVILDNCEHLLEPVAELVELLERDCAGVVALATSREGLAVEGERVVPVPSLPSPAPDAGPEIAGDADAVRLFAERARAVDPDFSLTVENTSAVVQVCRRVDGVPLAIELAAARVVAMSPAELAQGLERRFDTLAGGRRRAVQRHQTLRAAIDWSYDLLSDDERRLLARLAVFVGGCSRQAVDAVCSAEPLHRRKLFGLLTGLVAKSLVVAQRDGPETRYRLLETIREYGEERLEEHGETESLRVEHAEYFCQLALDLFERVYGPHQVAAGRQFDAERENLMAAMNYAIDTDNVDLALRLIHNVPIYGEPLGYRLVFPVDAVLCLPGAAEHPLYPYGMAVAANDAAVRGDLIRSAAAGDEALAAARRLSSTPDHFVNQIVSSARGSRATASGAWSEAAAHLEHSAELARSRGGPVSQVAYGLAGAATAYAVAGDPEAATRLASEGLDLARSVGTPMFIALNLVALAGALADRDRQRARSLLAESLELHSTHNFQSPYGATQTTLIAARLADWPLVLKLGPDAIDHLHWAGDRPFLAGILNVVACALAPGDPESAAVLQGAARRLIPAGVVASHPDAGGSSPGSPGSPAPNTSSFVTDLRRQTTAVLRDALGEPRLRQLRAQGESMEDDHIVAYALDALGRAARDQDSEAEPLLGDDDEHLSSTPPNGQNDFLLDGDVWLLSYNGRSCRLKDTKGLQYLAALLAHQGCEVHVFDLVTGGVAGSGSAVTLDDRAKAAYRQRLGELEAERAEASEWSDFERAERLRGEAEVITAELAAAYGLGGRPRRGADPVERARKAVANRIRAALAHIERAHPDLGRHLRNSVRTGTFCSYQPERPTLWNC